MKKCRKIQCELYFRETMLIHCKLIVNERCCYY